MCADIHLRMPTDLVSRPYTGFAPLSPIVEAEEIIEVGGAPKLEQRRLPDTKPKL